jgi:hypothetical protein
MTPALKITAQGGVGTAEEHQFLIDHYQLDSVGWGTPFLLGPEVTTVDKLTMQKLIEAEEDDLYLSDISPLGVPFNSLKGNTKDIERLSLISKGRPGSSCPKNFIAFNTEYTEKSICTASRQYQHLKIKDLNKEEISSDEYKNKFDKIVEKSCLCVGLGNSALLVNNIENRTEGDGVSICPGPNMAYFSKIMSLKEITDHIYGRANVIIRNDRPNIFIKELGLYIDYLKNKIAEAKGDLTDNRQKYLMTFTQNLKDGINYYSGLFNNLKDRFENKKSSILADLENSRDILNDIALEIESLSEVADTVQ